MENNWIKKNRKALGLSQAKLAAELGAGSSTVNAWEHGEKVPSAQMWPRVAAFFQGRGLEVPPMPDDLPNGRQRFKRDRMGTDHGKLREKRLATGLSVAALAAALGLNRHTVTDWESGKSVPSQKTIAALAEFYKCSSEELGFPRIKNSLTVEERNAILLGYLEDINKVCCAMRRLMYASGADQEDARQDAALAVLEAINRAEDPHDTEAMRHYIFPTIKGALLQSAKRSSDKGFTCIPAGFYPVLVPLEPLLAMGLGSQDERN